MGTESAHTDRLVQYAEKAWAAGNDTQQFAGNEMRKAIAYFLTGAAAKGDDFDVQLAALRPILDTIDERLVAIATEARDRDAWVKRVAEAFRIAGSQGDMLSIRPAGTQQQIYSGDEAEIELALTPDFASGQQLAEKLFEKNPNLAFINATVICSNPAFLAGFYRQIAKRTSTMSRDDLIRFLAEPENSKYLAQAFSRNYVSPRTATNLLDAIDRIFGGVIDIGPKLGSDDRAAFLNYIAADPIAAKNFVAAIGPEGQKELVGLSPGYYHHNFPGLMSAPVNILASYLTTVTDPIEVRRILDLVKNSGMLNDYGDFRNVQDFEPALKRLLETAVPKLVSGPPPKGANAQDFNDWIDGISGELNALKPFFDYIQKNYKEAHDNQSFIVSLITGFTVDWAYGLIPGGEVKDQVVGLLPWVNPDDVGGQIEKLLTSLPESAKNDPAVYTRISGVTTMVYLLASQGRILDRDGNKVVWNDIVNNPKFKDLLSTFTPKPGDVADDKKKSAEWDRMFQGGRTWIGDLNVDSDKTSLRSFTDDLFLDQE